MTQKIVYINLAQGLPIIFEDEKLLINIERLRYCYIRSTDIEQHNYKKVLVSVPDDMLFNLSQGNQVLIIDASGNNSKVINTFIPAFRNFLDKIWGLNVLEENGRVRFHIEQMFSTYYKDKDVQRKYDIFKKFLLARTIKLYGYVYKIKRERTYEEIYKMLKEYKNGKLND